MTTFLIVAYVAAVTLALTASLITSARLIRQRDAAVRRGDLAVAECARLGTTNTRQRMRNRLLMDQLDAQIEETHLARERVREVEARELPVLSEIRARRSA